MAKNLSPEQFEYFQYPMFVQAKDLMPMAHPHEIKTARFPMNSPAWNSPDNQRAGMWHNKHRQAVANGLMDSIGKEGIKQPVVLSNDSYDGWGTGGFDPPSPGGTIQDGHRRVAAAHHKFGPDAEIPVQWVTPSWNTGEDAALRWNWTDR